MEDRYPQSSDVRSIKAGGPPLAKHQRQDSVSHPSIAVLYEPSVESHHEHGYDNISIKREKSLVSLDRTPSALEEQRRVVYSSKEKWFIVTLSAIASMFSTISSPIYLPAIPELEKYFHTSTEMMNLTVTVYSVFQGISPMLWGSLSDALGRRPIIILCLIVYMGSCIGLALSGSYWLLFGMRILQAFGGASTVAIAGGIVADVTTRRNRGTYVGVSNGVALIGNCFGPLIGGGIAGRFGWRGIFWFLLIAVSIEILLLVIFFPETNHDIVEDGSIYSKNILTWSPYIYFRSRSTGVPSRLNDTTAIGTKTSPAGTKATLVRIFKKMRQCFVMLGQLDLILVLIPTSLHYTNWFMGLTALSSLFSTEYGFNVSQIGCAYLASGMGALFGSVSGGRLLSYRYKIRVEKYKQECLEKNEPVDMAQFKIQRARTELLPFYSVMLIVSTIIFGWTIKYKVHYVVPIIMTFFTSVSSVSFVTGSTTLLVDLFPSESASANACVNLCRCLLCAAGLAVVDTMIKSVGAGWTFTIVSFICLVSMVCIPLVNKLGPGIDTRRREKHGIQIQL